MKIVITVVATLLVVVVGALVVVYGGLAPVAATTPQGGALDRLLQAASDHAVEAHAHGMKVPDLSDPEMAKEGYNHYEDMCLGCHAGPGVERSEVSRGLNPTPPDLQKSGPFTGEGAAEAFWIIKHGIRMTGMPAFGPTHSDQKIWDIVAFLRRMETMTPADFARVQGGGPIVAPKTVKR
jgi:mono/diheme cytochrome c family protein